MNLSLRWKILFLTVLTPLTLAAAALLMINRDVSEHVDASSIHESLAHSQAVFEGMLATRSRALAGGAEVVVQDPRFFSLLMLGVSQRDRRFVATVKGMAHDFNRITQTDVFEVLDRQGQVLASVGVSRSTRAARDSLVRDALHGRTSQGVLIEPGAHFQAVAAPVHADGRVVGVLLLGAAIGTDLADELRSQMRCEVTFLSGHNITGTTLTDPAERAALLRTLARVGLGPETNVTRLGVLRIQSGQEFLTIVRRIPGTSPEREQYYVLQRSFDPEVMFQHAMQQDMVALAAVALILAMVSAILFSGTILGPLRRLVRGAREMEAGNYDHPLDVNRGDELGYLAEQFGRMRQRERAYVSSLEHAARLKSEFISIASHELRTPISVLSGYRDLLAEGELGPLTDKQKQALDAMDEYMGRLKRVAEDATRVAQVTGERVSLDVQPCELDPVVRRAVGAAIAEGTGRDVRVEASVEPYAETVEMDGQAVAQAITHLVTNGIRFTPDGGRVHVRAYVDDGRLFVCVKDTGIGMAPERLEALRSHGLAVRDSKHHQSATGLEFGSSGLGLGLALARGIVEAHGGHIEIESQQSLGSTFTIVLPVADATRAAA